ncbi:NAD-dependent epimerase/dehydratase family protein [Candidatus Pacearchaeota archaeon]|nr:NAD-dependent epimerase/dehydratase family protein [Candidatus Pacearchaeota archaeon]
MLKNNSILITGGNGFFGSHIVTTLITEERVSPEKIFTPSHKDYDLRKEEDVSKMFINLSPDIVIHLATSAKGINYNKEHLGTLYFDHVMMNTLLMQYAMKHKVKKFITIGTALAYPSDITIPFKEEDIWFGPCEPTMATIGVTSRAMLIQSQAYRKEFGLNAIYLIPANLYGPGDHFLDTHAHVIPATIKKFHKAKIEKLDEVKVWGTGKASREFLYVADAARAVIAAIKEYDDSAPLNLASGEEIKIKDLVEQIKDILEYKGKIIWDDSKPEGNLRRCLDASQMSKKIKFKPKIYFKEGIKNTIEWYLRNC